MTSANPRAFLPARKGAGPQGQGPGSQDAGDFQQGLGVGVPLWAPGVEVAKVVDVATSSSTSREFSSGDKQAIRSGRTVISGGQQSGAGSNELQAPGIGRTRAPGWFTPPRAARSSALAIVGCATALAAAEPDARFGGAGSQEPRWPGWVRWSAPLG